MKRSGGAALATSLLTIAPVHVSEASGSGGYVLNASLANGYHEFPSGGGATNSATAKVKIQVSGSGTSTVTVSIQVQVWVTGQYGATNFEAAAVTVTSSVDSEGVVTTETLGVGQVLPTGHGSTYTSQAGSTLTDYTAHSSGTYNVTGAGNGAVISVTGKCTVKRYQVDTDTHIGGPLPDQTHTETGTVTIIRQP